MRKPRQGDRVRVERDEAVWPMKGSWRQYRGRTGTVSSVNKAHTVSVGGVQKTIEAEYGVVFGAGTSGMPTWFRAHELTVLS